MTPNPRVTFLVAAMGALTGAWTVAPTTAVGQDGFTSPASAEEEIRQVWASLDERWNVRDADGFSSLFAEDARFVFVDRGESLDGRVEIHESFADRFPTFAPVIRHRTEIVQVRGIRPDVKAVDGRVQILRLDSGEADDGTVILTFAIFAVMLRSDGTWDIRELRVFELPTSPESADPPSP